MADNSGTLKDALEDWLEQNFSSGYTSCIKIHGRPILPPLMSEERRVEMRRLRNMAIAVENKLKRKEESIEQGQSASGEAMYEGPCDEPYFANSLPTSLAANVKESIESTESSQEGAHTSSQLNTDMLKEFDPLAEGNPIQSVPSPSSYLLGLSAHESLEKTSQADNSISKPSSAENSVALSCSTDLNQYMDITESSADMSIPCFDVDIKSSGGTGVTTPSTLRPDSADSKSQLDAFWREGKTTYEDLNKYLDSLLNNNSDPKKHQSFKDSNQNLVNSSMSTQSSTSTVSPPSLSLGAKQYNNNLPPLISPPGSLQTKIMPENVHVVTPDKRSVQHIDGSSDFLKSCTLSPVVRSDVQNSSEEKVKLYLQNLMTEDRVVDGLSQGSSSWCSQNLQENLSEVYPSSSCTNGNAAQRDAESNLNSYAHAQPRLVRSNSYTLDSPSPMLVAHMEAELRKNARNDTVLGKATASQNAGPTRRVWDVSTKDMPSWCNRQTNSSNQKVQSPKKVCNKSTSQANSSRNLESREAIQDISQKYVKSKIVPNSPKSGKSNVALSNKDVVDKVAESSGRDPADVPPGNEESKDNVRALLLQLQLQHNNEMEELLNRQRKEKEAIRLALLEEQRASLKNSEEPALKPLVSQNSANTLLNTVSQSPPTKDRVPLMIRRNTSPSLNDKENTNEQGGCFMQHSKSFSTSTDDISGSRVNSPLIDIVNEGEGSLNIKVVPYSQQVFKGAKKSQTLAVAEIGGKQVVPPNYCNTTLDMISSFPPSEPPTSSQLESMTSSLPPEILSLYYSNTEFTFKNANSVSCKTQSLSFNHPIPTTADAATVTQNFLPSAYASNTGSGSPHSKRRSWCSRQLFPEDIARNQPDWMLQSYEYEKIQAATKIQAGIRGYLTRRLLKTERVQNAITTIRDTIVCALQLQRDCAPHVEPSDLQLHGRLIQQLSAACEDLHNIFMGLPVAKRMAIIAADRERLRVRTPRSQSSSGTRPLSRATQIVLQRKMNQSDPSDSGSVHSRASSAGRSRRRSWAPVESRVRTSTLPTTVTNNCEVISGCLSRSSAPLSLPLQRSASVGSSRKPWR